MSKIADCIKDFMGENPFKDSAAKNFSDSKVVSEFFPTTTFWSLFNEQHEVLIGTRGSGKTILLKMMRYSMLKNIKDRLAQEIVESKAMIALYVPMNLEFLGEFNYQNISDKAKIEFFQFAFNCLLAESFLTEIMAMIEDQEEISVRAKMTYQIAKNISSLWFQNSNMEDYTDIPSLINGIKKIYYSRRVVDSLDDVAPVFTRTIGTPVQAVEHIVVQTFALASNPTWIICIDEAEFLSPCFQRCLNTLFRGDSKRIVVKVATLPFMHCTKETLVDGVFAEADGNDFSYRFIDMKYDSTDFTQVTNSLFTSRMKKHFQFENDIIPIEDFLGQVGTDDHVDYFRAEFGEEYDQSKIEAEILNELSERRQATARSRDVHDNSYKKEIYDKFSTIFYYRKMYKRSCEGHKIPAWFAGARMVRRIAQGNPRRFIQIMNLLFDRARKGSLRSKAQHEEVLRYSKLNCDATQGLPTHGPEAHMHLEAIGQWLHQRVHDTQLMDTGNTFVLDYSDYENSRSNEWIKTAVAYLRLTVDDTSLLNGLNKETTYTFANTYCAKYWLPMRTGGSPKLKTSDTGKYTYKLNPKGQGNTGAIQVSLFD